MNKPAEEHMEAIYRILGCLEMASDQGLFFKRTENKEVEIFTDVDWVGSIEDRRSTSGCCTYVWGKFGYLT